MKNPRGSALIEFAFALPIFSTLVMGSLLLISLWMAKAWVHFSLYEGLICLAEGQSTSSCEMQTQKRIQGMLPSKKVSVQLSKTPFIKSYSGTVHLLLAKELKLIASSTEYEYSLKLNDPSKKYRKKQ